MRIVAAVSATLLTAWSGVLLAQEAWVLQYRSDRYVLARTSVATLKDVASFVGPATWGESAAALAVLSYKPALGGYVLDLIDKSSQQTLVTWPIGGVPTVQHGGPASMVMLTDADAYFITLHGYSSPGPNDLAGFDFNRLRLADGTIQRVPLSKNFASPRVVSLSATPLIYEWNGYGVWEFDAARGAIRKLVGQAELSDILASENAARREPSRSEGVAEFVAVPGAGMFRLSKAGELHQILRADLTPVSAPHRAAALGGGKIQVFSIEVEGRPAIGFLREDDTGLTTFGYVDARSLTVTTQATMPHASVADLAVPAANGNLYYLDRTTHSIERLSKQGATTVHTLQPGELLPDTRLVIVEDP